VERTVDLSGQTPGYTEEVDEVRSERYLASELVAVDLSVS